MPLPFVGTKASTVVVNKEPANFSLLLFFPCTKFTQQNLMIPHHNVQAFQLIVLAGHLLGVPGPFVC